MKYRYCSVYLVLQFSYNTKKLRLLAYGYDKPMPDLSKMSLEEQLCIPQGHNISLVKKNTIIEFFSKRKHVIDHNIIMNKLMKKELIYFI